MTDTWYVGNQIGEGSYKNVFEITNSNNSNGFDPAESDKFGKSSNPDDYALLVLKYNRSRFITEGQLLSLYKELELQDNLSQDGRAVPPVALQLLIEGAGVKTVYGIRQILNELAKYVDIDSDTETFPNIIACMILVRRCDLNISEQFREPAGLLRALFELIEYIVYEKNIVILDGKPGNYCIYYNIIITLDLDRKYVIDLKHPLDASDNEKWKNKQVRAVRRMALLFAFVDKVYPDERRLSEFKKLVLSTFNIVSLNPDGSCNERDTERKLRDIYTEFGDIGKRTMDHYFPRDNENMSIPTHILRNCILPLFNPQIPQIDDSIPERKRAIDKVQETTVRKVQKPNGSTPMPTWSNNLGGRSRKMRKRKRKPKYIKTRRKRSLLNHNLTR